MGKSKKKKAENKNLEIIEQTRIAQSVTANVPATMIQNLEKQVNEVMAQSGLFCRVFSRQKSGTSVAKKITEKKKTKGNDYKMQDLFGVRIALYFTDDISVCRELIGNCFEVLHVSEDEKTTTDFKPVRLNIICSIPEEITKLVYKGSFWDSCSIDKTFEIQIRTVFSEGWHEIDHDLRYKCKEDWEGEANEAMSRTLNGILATLETCNWSIISLFDQLAYEKYKAGNWKAMLRNKFRIRMTDEELHHKIEKIFNEKKEVAKEFYKLDRESLIKEMSSNGLEKIPKSMTNIIYVANELYVKNSDIKKCMPKEIKKYLDEYKRCARV